MVVLLIEVLDLAVDLSHCDKVHVRLSR